MSYDSKEQVFDIIVSQCMSKRDVINFIFKECGEDKEFLEKNLKGKVIL